MKESYLRRVLRQGSTPFRYRSGVRSLLGMPAGGEDAIIGAVGAPPIEFRYALPPSPAPMAAMELLTAEQWLEAALDDPDSDKMEENPATPRAGAVGAAPPPRSGQGPPTLAPAATHLQVTPADADASGSWGKTTGRMGRAERERSETHHSPGHAEPMGFTALRAVLPILQQDGAGAVGAAPPPRSEQKPPALAPEVALPQVTFVDLVPTPTLVSQAGALPSDASLDGPASAPSSAARTHESGVQPVDFTAVPAAIDNRKAGRTSGFVPARVADTRAVQEPGAGDNKPMGNAHFRPAVVSTPMPLADAPPGIGITTTTYPSARRAAEQIARLQRTVAELTAQIATQRHLKPEVPSSKTPPQVGSGGTPPSFSNRDSGTPRPQTPRAFWERSYLDRLYRWSGR